MMNFQRMPDTVLPHFKGGKGEMVAKMYNDDLNRILLARLAPGHSVGLHSHDTSSEIMYFLSGKGTVILNGAVIPFSTTARKIFCSLRSCLSSKKKPHSY